MFALRSLLRQRTYFALSLATLALAVGANLVVFSVVNALWLRPRPVKDPGRVVVGSFQNLGSDRLGRGVR